MTEASASCLPGEGGDNFILPSQPSQPSLLSSYPPSTSNSNSNPLSPQPGQSTSTFSIPYNPDNPLYDPSNLKRAVQEIISQSKERRIRKSERKKDGSSKASKRGRSRSLTKKNEDSTGMSTESEIDSAEDDGEGFKIVAKKRKDPPSQETLTGREKTRRTNDISSGEANNERADESPVIDRLIDVL